jgi:hypothetical protein
MPTKFGRKQKQIKIRKKQQKHNGRCALLMISKHWVTVCIVLPKVAKVSVAVTWLAEWLMQLEAHTLPRIHAGFLRSGGFRDSTTEGAKQILIYFAFPLHRNELMNKLVNSALLNRY